MRDYYAHFSFYSEEWGNFDDITYKVQAYSPFAARKKAWLEWDRDDESKLRSCVKLYAVTWEPNLLDAGDYFYAHAADIKQAMGRVENVDIPNSRIEKSHRPSYLDGEKRYCWGALQTLDRIAKDLYAGKGMVPPSIHEELHYAKELLYQQDCGELENALWDKIEAAKKWEENAYRFAFQDFFKYGHISLGRELLNFKTQFDRNGIYPVYADLDDTEYQYISRWQRSWKTCQLVKLQPLQQADVIPHSAGYMLFDGYHLLIDPEHLHEDYRKPENMIWTTAEGVMDITKDVTERFLVENVITGDRMMAGRKDFIGVLRPDVVARYDFEALKAEYAAASETQSIVMENDSVATSDIDEDEQDWQDEMEP